MAYLWHCWIWWSPRFRVTKVGLCQSNQPNNILGPNYRMTGNLIWAAVHPYREAIGKCFRFREGPDGTKRWNNRVLGHFHDRSNICVTWFS